MSSSSMYAVVTLGAGPAGLSFSSHFNHKTDIYEKESSWGGRCRSHVVDGFTFDEGVVTVPASGGEIYNIGSGSQHSIGEVVSMITTIIGNGVEPMWGKVNSRRPEPGSWVADISKAKSELGWLPSTSLEAGLNKTVQWFRENLELYP